MTPAAKSPAPAKRVAKQRRDVEPLADWLARHPLPDPFSTENKEERGRVLVVGGSVQVPGGVWLAGRAALHAGAGKLQVATTSSTAVPLAVRLPEAMVLALTEDPHGEIARVNAATFKVAREADAVLVGPGMGSQRSSRRLVCDVLAVVQCPWVLDAAAIIEPQAIARFGTGVVTPHAGEMAKAMGLEREEVEARPLEIARDYASRAGCIVVMKGVPTHVVDADGTALEYCAQAPGLGTSGSGDVLAGLIAGLIARGAAPMAAAAWGVWLHAQAGLALGARVGPVGYLAREISPEVPRLMHVGVAGGAG